MRKNKKRNHQKHPVPNHKYKDRLFRLVFNNSLAGTFLIMTTITIVLPTLEVARKLNAITETQSDAFILAAVVVCILGPILFNSLFILKKEDKNKKIASTE